MTSPTLLLLSCILMAGPAGDDSLKERVGALIAPFGDKVIVEVAFRDLETGETCLIRADEPIHPASTMKVPVMLEVYRQAGEGKLSLDDRIAIKNSFASLVDGSPFALDPKDDSELTLYKRLGEEVTVRELVRLMITESSNVATNILVEKVSPASTTGYMKDLGAEGVKVLRGVEDNKAYAKGMNNVATAGGLMTILARLAEGSAVSKSASAEMLDVLRGQKFNEGIPAGLPRGTAVAHKTGSFQGVYHDAGVVELPGRKPFVLVVLTRGIQDEPAAHTLVAAIARLAYERATRNSKRKG
jgi:beta-lactamase class A